MKKDKSILNDNNVPIWVRADCNCLTCCYLRNLDGKRKENKGHPRKLFVGAI